MTFDWQMLYPLHTVILDNSQVFGGVPCKAQLCNFSKWFFSPRFGGVPIWELWQFCYVRIGPPKIRGDTWDSLRRPPYLHHMPAYAHVTGVYASLVSIAHGLLAPWVAVDTAQAGGGGILLHPSPLKSS